MTVLIYPDPDSLAKVTAARLCIALADAGATRPDVHLAIAGGSVGTSLVAALPRSELAAEVNWEAVHVWWVDERFVPHGDKDRNDAPLDEVFTDLQIPAANIHRGPAPEEVGDVEQAAARYAAELAEYAAPGATTPLFDVVLLGMGPDGHVASLFPGHPSPDDVATFAIADSPKPPAERISLSLAALNHTRRLWVGAWGAEKAPAIAAALGGAAVSEIPAAGVRGQEETLWLTDLAGAADL